MAEPVVAASGITKGYGEGPVLKSLDLKIEAGSFLAVLGPSGSGKSTLLNLLGLMDRPDEGEIVFSGSATKALSEDARGRLRNERLGFIFQFDSLLPEFTVWENVLLPARIALAQGRAQPEPETRAGELLARLGLSKLGARLPNQLSGGERQRAAICRALINRPTLVLADEPTGNLDKVNGEMVFSHLQALAKDQKAAIVMVTHNEAACGYADRVLRMHDGTLTESA